MLMVERRLDSQGVLDDGRRRTPGRTLPLEAARVACLSTLEDKDGYGLGFVIVHRGQLADWVVLCWWTDDDIMRRRVLTHSGGRR